MTELGPLVDAAWLAANRDTVVAADVRWYLDGRSGREAYDRAHIPGARFVDLDTDLSGPPTAAGGRHPLPSPEAFAAAMGRLGIGSDTTVVAYDDVGGVVASRLWWMLDSLGCGAAVLDGGLDAWTGGLDTDPPSWPPTTFTARPWPDDRYASIDEVDAARSDPATVVIDARSAERFRGEPNPIETRYGHIPGAVSVPVNENLADGRLGPAPELRTRLTQVGADTAEVIAYCGSGVSACHDLLAMRHAGLGDGRLFVGSWSAWSADPDRPVETG